MLNKLKIFNIIFKKTFSFNICVKKHWYATSAIFVLEWRHFHGFSSKLNVYAKFRLYRLTITVLKSNLNIWPTLTRQVKTKACIFYLFFFWWRVRYDGMSYHHLLKTVKVYHWLFNEVGVVNRNVSWQTSPLSLCFPYIPN